MPRWLWRLLNVTLLGSLTHIESLQTSANHVLGCRWEEGRALGNPTGPVVHSLVQIRPILSDSHPPTPSTGPASLAYCSTHSQQATALSSLALLPNPVQPFCRAELSC